MSAFRRVLNQLQAQLRLGALSLITLQKKPRITAKLSELRQFRQDLDFCRLKFLFALSGQKHDKPLHMGVVKLSLLPLHGCVHILLNFVRKVGKHILLQPP